MLVAVLENPNYLINIGNAIRNVDGLGVDALFVIDGMKRLDEAPEILRKRKSLIKHSSGAVQFTAIKRFDTSGDCFDYLEKKGFVSVATSPSSGQKSSLLQKTNLTQPNLAIWFGDEGNGLSQEVLERCACHLHIEMTGQVESFSLGTSTGIVLYEAMRQRRIS